jgi:hypothetical protein
MMKGVNPSIPQHKCWGLHFDKRKALSSIEGLSLPAGRQGLTLSKRFFSQP